MKWDLGKLYSGFDDPAIGQDEAKLQALLDEAEKAVSGETADLHAAVAALQEGLVILSAYASYVMLTMSADARNEGALKLRDRTLRAEMRLQQLSSAMSRALAGMDDLDARIEADPLLKEHAFMLKEMREEAAHTIDAAAESAVLEMHLNGASAFSNLRDQLDANHMVPYNGEKLPLSAIRNMAYDADGAVRKAAYEAELASYPAMEIPMAACLNAIKGEALTMCRLKKYDSVLDMTLQQSRMDRQTLDTMLDVIEKNMPAFRDILKTKAKALGHKGGLPFYDLFAPLGKVGGKYTLDDARDMLVECMGSFSPRMGEMISEAFRDRWIDAYPREGKTGGAFCAESYRTKTSYILTNFDGSLSDVSTLAHELGHAFHNDCLYTRSPLNADTPMPLAETASTFNEIVFAQAMQAKAAPEEKLHLLDEELTDAVQVIVDIMSRYLFETEVVARRADGELSPRELCGIMLDAQMKTYGDGLDPDFMHPYMWACKSHYYFSDTHFYNFPYAFGMLFGRGVYAKYMEEGPSYESKYRQLLSSTGMMNIYDVAKSAGIDLHDPAFWQKSIDSILKDAAEFKALVG